jgi:hypothetical protein
VKYQAGVIVEMKCRAPGLANAAVVRLNFLLIHGDDLCLVRPGGASRAKKRDGYDGEWINLH